MFKRLFCLFFGHKEGLKIQSQNKYSVYICERCGTLYAKKDK